MRLGGPLVGVLPGTTMDPDQWARELKGHGFSACYLPCLPHAAQETVKGFTDAAERHGLLIAEIGAWSNPLDADPVKAAAAMEKCCGNLALAERVGARCCVNIAGSRNPAKWDGPHPLNLTDETFDMIVQSVRKVIDAVKPTRTFYALETMPWIFPDSADSYLRLIRAIDRPAFAVHLDPVNIVNSPARLFDTTTLINDCFDKLGPYIKSVHAKDITIENKLTLHLNECRPGTGFLDYKAFVRGMGRLPADTPFMLEHLPTQEEYSLAAAFVRKVAQETGVQVS